MKKIVKKKTRLQKAYDVFCEISIGLCILAIVIMAYSSMRLYTAAKENMVIVLCVLVDENLECDL